MVWKMIFLFQGCILRFHVNLPWCTSPGPQKITSKNLQKHYEVINVCPVYILGNKATDGTYGSKYFFHLSRVLRRCKPIGLVNYVVYPHVSPRSSEYKPEMFVYPKQHFWLWVMSHDYGLITPEDLGGYWELIYSYTSYMYDFLPILLRFL